MRRIPQLLLSAALTLSLAACTQSDSGTPKPDAPATQEPGGPGAEAEPSAQPDYPPGAELLAAHVEASGGAEAIAKFESIHVLGTVAVESQNLRGSMELWWQKGGKVYLEQDIEGIGKSRVGYDGETIWLEDPITGLRKLDGKEAAAYKQSSLMFLGHDWPEFFSAANTLGTRTFAGREVYEVELVGKDGPNLTLGLDVETKMIHYAKSVQPSMLGDMPVEVRSDRYEDVEGYKFAMHRVNALSTLLELDETITKFEVNVPIDPAMFEFPSKREVVEADPSKQ
jgi:hypothetical protein